MAIRINETKIRIPDGKRQTYKKTNTGFYWCAEKIQKMQREFAENWYKAVDYRRAEIMPNGKVEPREPLSIHTPYEPLELE